MRRNGFVSGTAMTGSARSVADPAWGMDVLSVRRDPDVKRVGPGESVLVRRDGRHVAGGFAILPRGCFSVAKPRATAGSGAAGRKDSSWGAWATASLARVWWRRSHER